MFIVVIRRLLQRHLSLRKLS